MKRCRDRSLEPSGEPFWRTGVSKGVKVDLSDPETRSRNYEGQRL
jgi:hypothetical protein